MLITSTRRQLIADAYSAVQIQRMIQIALALGSTPYDRLVEDLVWASQHARRLGI